MKGYVWILNNQKQHYYLPEICQLLGRSFERSRSHQLSWTYRGDIWPTVQLVCISLQSLTTALPPVKTMPSFCIRWRNTPTVCVCVWMLKGNVWTNLLQAREWDGQIRSWWKSLPFCPVFSCYLNGAIPWCWCFRTWTNILMCWCEMVVIWMGANTNSWLIKINHHLWLC